MSHIKKVRLALDWTPNTNHCGIYTASLMEWYDENCIDLQIIHPSNDYTSEETPARMVANGKADLCIAPSESVISCWTSDSGKPRPVAVAALLQRDTSAIVTLKRSGIDDPSQLDGRRYASYQGRFEMPIVQHFIKQSGGKGEAVEVVPPKLDCFDAVLRGDADATWVFLGWEGIEAEMKGIELNKFELSASAVPYGYSPVILASPEFIARDDGALLRKVLEMTGAGYRYSVKNPEYAATALFQGAGHESVKSAGMEMLLRAQEFLSNGSYILDAEERWGHMDAERWERFVAWLLENQLLTHRDGTVVKREELDSSTLFTNDFLPKRSSDVKI